MNLSMNSTPFLIHGRFWDGLTKYYIENGVQFKGSRANQRNDRNFEPHTPDTSLLRLKVHNFKFSYIEIFLECYCMKIRPNLIQKEN